MCLSVVEEFFFRRSDRRKIRNAFFHPHGDGRRERTVGKTDRVVRCAKPVRVPIQNAHRFRRNLFRTAVVIENPGGKVRRRKDGKRDSVFIGKRDTQRKRQHLEKRQRDTLTDQLPIIRRRRDLCAHIIYAVRMR